MTHSPLSEDELRKKIALQIVKARVPGYKMTKGEWKDEASLVPDTYINNILTLITAQKEAWQRETLDNVRKIIIKKGMPDNYYGEVWEWVRDGINELKKGGE